MAVTVGRLTEPEPGLFAMPAELTGMAPGVDCGIGLLASGALG